jgi:DNA polymerase-3 subunit epsilon
VRSDDPALAHSAWLALDFEASDKDPETARIVSCALILVGGGPAHDTRTWLVNPGIAQEPGAIAVHKLTDEYLAEHGTPAEQGGR